MEIKNARDFGYALAQGRYTSLGGYPTFFLTSDGGCLSFVDAWEERAQIVSALLEYEREGYERSGWRVVCFDVNWEDAELYSDHSGERIESAYAEDDAHGEPQEAPESYRAWLKRTTGRSVARRLQEACERA